MNFNVMIYISVAMPMDTSSNCFSISPRWNAWGYSCIHLGFSIHKEFGWYDWCWSLLRSPKILWCWCVLLLIPNMRLVILEKLHPFQGACWLGCQQFPPVSISRCVGWFVRYDCSMSFLSVSNWLQVVFGSLHLFQFQWCLAWFVGWNCLILFHGSSTFKLL